MATMDLRELRRRMRERGSNTASAPPLEDAPSRGVAAAAPTSLALPEQEPPEPAALAEVKQRWPLLGAQLGALDAWQLAAVFADEPRAVVRAQVGSGKTTVLVHRALRLHLHDGVPLERMALLTFTHRAADQMRDRLAQATGSSSASSATAGRSLPGRVPTWLFGTFHSVARTLLARSLPVEELGYSRDFRVLDAGEQAEVWRRLIHQHHLDIKYEARLDRRVEALAAGRVLFGAMKKPDDIERLVHLAEQDKRANGWMDFSDLLRHATELLLQHPLPDPPSHVLVDELQDCDEAQLRFVDALGQGKAAFFGVGDPNQEIYAWRGAGPGGFDRIAKATGTRVYALPCNYRSVEPIVANARALLIRPPMWLRGTGEDAAQQLLARRMGGAPVQVVRHATPYAEALYVAARLRHAQASEGRAWSAFAVMARTRRQLELVRGVFEKGGIPVVEQSQPALRDSAVARWLIHVLRAALDPHDPDAVFEAFLHPTYGLMPSRALCATDVFARASAAGTSLAAAFAQLARDASDRARRNAADLAFAAETATALERLGSTWGSLPAAELEVEEVARELRLEAWLGPTRSQFAAERAEARRVLDALVGVAREAGGDAAAALVGALAAAPITPAVMGVGQHVEAVRLLTIHAAKGLEFEDVFLLGINDGVIPLGGRGRLDPEHAQDEQRLLFVGLTRGRERVEISWCVQPDVPQAAPEPSPFLRLLPRDFCQWLDVPPPVPSAPEPCPPSKEGTGLTTSDHAASPWHVGLRVRHGRYGVGLIEDVSPDYVRCRFEAVGVKSFHPSLCPLVPEPTDDL